MIRIVLLLIALSIFAPTIKAEKSSDLSELITELEQKMSSLSSVNTSFTQKKRLSIFNRDLILNGKLYMQKPGNLAWHTLKPLRYTMVLKGETMKQWDEDTDSVQTIDLSDQQTFKVIFDQMKMWFEGDYTSIKKSFNVELLSAKPPLLKFIPRDKSIATDFLKSVQILFREDLAYINQITLTEKSGDSTELTFSDTVLNAPIPEKAWKLGE